MELRETRMEQAWKVELLDGGTSLSRCRVVDVVMRIGSCPVRTGGIGEVGTLPEHRNKGLSRQVMEASVRLMQRKRYAISFLHGIPSFYDKFGFITCMADHPFAVYCRQFGCQDGTQCPRNGGGMGQIIDLAACMEAILPEMAERWGPGDRGEHVGLRTDIGAATLRWKRGELVLEEAAGTSCVRVRQDHLMQLLMGYVRVEDLAHAGKIKITRGKRALLDRLYPLQHAQLWWADRF